MISVCGLKKICISSLNYLLVPGKYWHSSLWKFVIFTSEILAFSNNILRLKVFRGIRRKGIIPQDIRPSSHPILFQVRRLATDLILVTIKEVVHKPV